MNVIDKIRWYGVSLIRNVSGIISILLMPFIFLIAFISRFIPRKYDVGIGPVPLINNVYLKKSLESQGYAVETYVTDVYKITDEFDCIMKNWLYRRAPFLRLFPILFKYRSLYIYFDGGVLANRRVYRHLEAYIYKIAGIKTIVMPYGSDCTIAERTPNIYFKNALFQDYSDFYKKKQDRVRWRVGYWCRNADVVIAIGDDIDYLTYWDCARQSVLSIDLDTLAPCKNFRFCTGDSIKIVHAPNHMSIKGTVFIEKAIETLKEEGCKIDYIRLHGKTNKEVLEVLRDADIVVDQIVLGWHGIFALEALAHGKPVITHIRSDLLDAYENMGCIEKDELPLIDATPTTIYSVLKELLEHTDRLEEIGIKSRRYVEKYHSIAEIGQYFDKINQSVGIMPSKIG